MAWLFATEKPVFSLLIISFTKGNLSLTSSTDWSTELLSTTNTSASIFFIALCTDCRHCSRKCFTL